MLLTDMPQEEKEMQLRTFEIEARILARLSSRKVIRLHGACLTEVLPPPPPPPNCSHISPHPSSPTADTHCCMCISPAAPLARPDWCLTPPTPIFGHVTAALITQPNYAMVLEYIGGPTLDHLIHKESAELSYRRILQLGLEASPPPPPPLPVPFRFPALKHSSSESEVKERMCAFVYLIVLQRRQMICAHIRC